MGLTKHLPYDSDIRVPFYIRGPGIKKGTESDAVVGNVDILPTFLSLADIKYDTDTYDGIDFSTYIMEDDYYDEFEDEDDDTNVGIKQRDTWLSQYMSIGTKCIAECGAWYPGKDGSFYPGRTASAPCYNDDNEAWMMDENTLGNWRAIRIINDTDNLMYVEWYKLEQPKNTWNDSVFGTAYWNELYNVEDDPYQIYNMWDDISSERQQEYRDMLR